MLTTAIIGLILVAGVIHPHLQKQLGNLQNNDMIEVIVHMKNRPDLNILPAGTSKQEKIQFLQDYARLDQEAISSYLLANHDRAMGVQTYWIFNGLAFKATRKLILSLTSRTDIDYIIDDYTISYIDANMQEGSGKTLRTPEWNIQKIKADSCWNDGYNDGYDGTGIIIGTMDTGVDTSHPALHGKWRPAGWFDAVNGQPGPYDDHGHGVRMMGIICGGDGHGPFSDDSD